MLRLRVETLEIELKTKDEDIKRLTGPKTPHEERCKVILSPKYYIFQYNYKTADTTRFYRS